jgi:hypothetical protein
MSEVLVGREPVSEAVRRQLIELVGAPEGELIERLNPLYYARAGAPKALWNVPGGGHTGALTAYPRGYEQRVVGFLDRWLLRGR